jgi:hypothetical protein
MVQGHEHDERNKQNGGNLTPRTCFVLMKVYGALPALSANPGTFGKSRRCSFFREQLVIL